VDVFFETRCRSILTVPIKFVKKKHFQSLNIYDIAFVVCPCTRGVSGKSMPK